jgi:hypothetical protein
LEFSVYKLNVLPCSVLTYLLHSGLRLGVMVFNATFNNISAIWWQSVLLVEETGVPGENHRPVASHWQTWSHKCCIEYTKPEWDSNSALVVIGTDCIGSYKSNYLMILTTTATYKMGYNVLNLFFSDQYIKIS